MPNGGHSKFPKMAKENAQREPKKLPNNMQFSLPSTRTCMVESSSPAVFSSGLWAESHRRHDPQTRNHRYVLVHPATKLLVHTPRVYEALRLYCVVCRYGQHMVNTPSDCDLITQPIPTITKPSSRQPTTLDVLAASEELQTDNLSLERSDFPPGSAEIMMSTSTPLSPEVFKESHV